MSRNLPPLACAALLVSACPQAPSAGKGSPRADAGRADVAVGPVVTGDYVRTGHFPDVPTAGPISIPGSVSGSRLRSVRWEGGGARTPAWWFDQQLKIACSFDRATDGELRCLPRELVTEGPFHDSDPACGPDSRVVRRRRSTCPPPAYASLVSTDTCPDSRAIHYLGPELSLGPQIYRVSDGGKCFKVTATSAYQWYFVGEALPPTMFVKGTVKQEPAPSGPLGLSFLEGEDGSRQLQSYRDLAGGFDCGLQTAADGKLRCLPVQQQDTLDGSLPDFFADAMCTVPAMVPRVSSCMPGQQYFRRYGSRKACPVPVSAYRGKDKLAAAYWSSGTKCTPQAPDPRWEFVSLEELPPATLQEASNAVAPGTGRLRTPVVVTSAGVAPRGAFWDPKFASYCSARVASDGVTRCLPSSWDDVDLYTAAGCTGPAFVTSAEATHCQVSFASLSVPGTCPVRRSVHPISATPQKVPTTTTLYGRSAEGCVRNSGIETVHSLGPEIPPTEFEPLTLIME